MTLLGFMFSSPYDQASLAVAAIGLVIHLVADLVKARASAGVK